MKHLLFFIILIIPLHIEAFTTCSTPPPITSPQNFCDYATVADLSATGTDLLWYVNISESVPLASEALLSTGTYYVSQTINDEESERVPVVVTINQAPLVDELGEVYGCSVFVLPPLAVGNYFADENHSEPFFAGDIISISKVMYVYGENECGSAQSQFYITIESELSLPSEQSAEACNSYFLPDFSEGGYYTQSGGTGSMYAGGEEITMSQVLYKYVENSCGSAETVFTITVNAEPYVDFLDDVYTCESYTLPYIGSGNYYTQPNTAGDILFAGDLITSSQVIYLYAGNGCGEAQGSFYVDIVEIDNTISLEVDTLTANQIDASYQWWDCNTETFISDENGQSFTTSIAGFYSVLITIGDCSVWSDCVLSHPLSLENNKLETISFFPNPASSTVTFQTQQNQKIDQITLLDLSGKIVLQNDNNNSINIENLSSGIYIMKVLYDGKVFHEKLIKQ